jgi:hypothetical protein
LDGLNLSKVQIIDLEPYLCEGNKCFAFKLAISSIQTMIIFLFLVHTTLQEKLKVKYLIIK